MRIVVDLDAAAAMRDTQLLDDEVDAITNLRGSLRHYCVVGGEMLLA